jgi:biopolymer transport protein ExbD
MRQQRSIRNRGRRKKIGFVDLDITSLLDILVILLVFLLKSYNASGIVLDVPKGIKLPVSQSKKLNTSGIIVQASPEKIWVDSEIVLDIHKPPPRVYDQGRRRIIPLYNELVKKKQIIKQTEKSAPEAKRFTGMVNLIIDKSLRYNYLKKLMYTCAAAGFKQYKFVVLSEEEL